jgi:hypothetical protein
MAKLEAAKISIINNCTCFFRRFYTSTRRAKEENHNFAILKGSLHEGKIRKYLIVYILNLELRSVTDTASVV